MDVAANGVGAVSSPQAGNRLQDMKYEDFYYDIPTPRGELRQTRLFNVFEGALQ